MDVSVGHVSKLAKNSRGGRLAESAGEEICPHFRCACIGGETGNERKRKWKRTAFLETRRYLTPEPWKRAADRFWEWVETRDLVIIPEPRRYAGDRFLFAKALAPPNAQA
jgi:hypothetical protein